MNQLQIEHKKSLTTDQKQVVSKEEQKEKKKDKRPGKGRCITLSRNVFRILNSDVYYVESENSENIYYYCKYNFSGFSGFCACPDNSTRHMKCKHIWSIEFAISFETLKDIDKLPVETKRYNNGATTTAAAKKSSYEEDEYSF